MSGFVRCFMITISVHCGEILKCIYECLISLLRSTETLVGKSLMTWFPRLQLPSVNSTLISNK